MAHYKCPVTTCNVNFEGSIFDIVIPAVMHGEGSHKMYLSDNDVAKIIEKQARLESVDEFVPKEPIAEQTLESQPVIPTQRRHYDWWKK